MPIDRHSDMRLKHIATGGDISIAINSALLCANLRTEPVPALCTNVCELA